MNRRLAPAFAGVAGFVLGRQVRHTIRGYRSNRERVRVCEEAAAVYRDLRIECARRLAEAATPEERDQIATEIAATGERVARAVEGFLDAIDADADTAR